MPTKAGKIQVRDIRQGKVFYLVNADFPMVGPGTVGDGEVSSILPIYPVRKPYYKRRKLKFDYRDARGRLGTIDINHMQAVHGEVFLTSNRLHTPIFVSFKAATRFAKAFDNRKPTKDERSHARHRQSLKEDQSLQ